MFEPDYTVKKCPICGAELERNQFMGYGITAGYNSACKNCGKYNDIWACGIREVQVGDWLSDSYLSKYGTPTKEEEQIAKDNDKKINKLIFLEKLKWKLFHK